MKILHVLDHSRPYFSGYSFRSESILGAQQQLGWQPIAITSPKHEAFGNNIETINGIEYHRTHWPAVSSLQAIPMARQVAAMAALAKEVKRLAAEREVNLIHAHSPSLCGLAAAKAAKALNLPLVYELRYYEEDAAVDRGKTRYNSLRYRLSQRAELEALHQADAVSTISNALREDLIRRGIPSEKIFLVPNGVDTKGFNPIEPDKELIIRHELQNKTVIGFIGSFYFYEGLDVLIDAVALLFAHHSDVKLLLVGEGEAEEMLRQRIPAPFRDNVIFTGNVPHDEVRRYYSVMDILVYSRRRSRLTELTTPLKPLEAMAMEKVVIASDVGGLRELLNDGEVGVLVEADTAETLSILLWRLVEDKSARSTMARQAREFVVQQRDWQHIAERYSVVYGYARNQTQIQST